MSQGAAAAAAEQRHGWAVRQASDCRELLCTQQAPCAIHQGLPVVTQWPHPTLLSKVSVAVPRSHSVWAKRKRILLPKPSPTFTSRPIVHRNMVLHAHYSAAEDTAPCPLRAIHHRLKGTALSQLPSCKQTSQCRSSPLGTQGTSLPICRPNWEPDSSSTSNSQDWFWSPPRRLA